MMLNLKLIENGYLRVGVVAHSEEKRKELEEGFRGLNFHSVVGVENFEAARNEIKRGRLQWVFSTLKDDTGASIEDFIDDIYQDLNMIPVVFSVVVGPNDLRHLPRLFAKGLFTWHPDKGVPEYTRQSLWRLKERLPKCTALVPSFPIYFYEATLKKRISGRKWLACARE